MSEEQAQNIEAQEQEMSKAQEEQKTHEPSLTAELEEKIAKLTDGFARAMAENENLRKRHTKEMADARSFAVEKFAKDLLSVYDNLDRALQNAESGALAEGVELTRKELKNTFEKNGINRVNPEQGATFDHNVHQAMVQVETNDVANGCVFETMQAGYTLNGRVLRAAMVSVAKTAAEQK